MSNNPGEEPQNNNVGNPYGPGKMPPVPVVPNANTLSSSGSAYPPVGAPGAPRAYVKRNHPVKTYWGGTAILGAGVVFLLMQIILAIALVAYIVISDPSNVMNIQGDADELTDLVSQQPLALVIAQLGLYFSWLVCLWWVTKYRSGVQLGKKFWKAFQDNVWLHFKKKDILIGLGIAVAMMALQLLILNGLPALFPNLNMEGADNTAIFNSLPGVWFVIIAFGIGGILGPICEELFFRGFLLRGFVNHFSFTKESRNIDLLEEEAGKQSFALKNLIVAYRGWASRHKYAISIIITSTVFGFMHFQGSETFGQWLVVIVTGTLGLVLGYTTYKLQRIYPAIFAHIIYNSLSFFFLLLSR
jgi:membrane protease YdiL (CAAX protease family)